MTMPVTQPSTYDTITYDGVVGPAGPPGPAGPQGPQGPQGVAGPTGPTGPAGATGAQGVPGTAGAQGPQGLPGPSGPQGIQGTAGPTGPQGPAGLGLNIKGTVPTQAALPAQPQPQNDAYATVDTGHLYASSGTQWVDTGLIRGPAGPTGPTGAQGPAGAQGQQGIPGAAGPQGLTGAQGPQGTQGIPGPVGPQGPSGNPSGAPLLGIGVIVHWRPPNAVYDRYALCKPAVVVDIVDLTNNILSIAVISPAFNQGPVMLQDQVQEGHTEGLWHYISDCPFSQSLAQSILVRSPQLLIGAAV